MAVYEDDRDVTFEIMEEIGIISTQDTGWTREINLVRWNGGVAKYDIRDWDPYHQRMSKGITLTEEEAGTYTYALALDEEYLASPDTLYPVTVDPTVTWKGMDSE